MYEDLYERHASTWWQSIPSPAAWLDHVAMNLKQGTSMCIPSIKSLPWQDVFTSLLDAQIQDSQRKSERPIYSKMNQDPGEVLFNLFCKSDKRSRYRPGKTRARFLAESDEISLHNCYIRVLDLNQQEYEKWESFITEYNSIRKSKNKAVFLLQMEGKKLPESKGPIQTTSYHETIHAFDILTWTSLMTSLLQINEEWKPYLAEIVSGLCFGNMELAGRLLEDPTEMMEYPLTRTNRILQEEFPDLYEELKVKSAQLLDVRNHNDNTIGFFKDPSHTGYEKQDTSSPQYKYGQDENYQSENDPEDYEYDDDEYGISWEDEQYLQEQYDPEYLETQRKHQAEKELSREPILNRTLWKSQVKTIYPAIEPFRTSIIQYHYDLIQRILSDPSNKDKSVTDPADVEIGYLAKMIKNKQLYVPKSILNVYQSFRKARNELAHIEVVPSWQVKKILAWKEEG